MLKSKMIIYKASESGFCYGVKRSIDLIERLRKENPEEIIYTFGPIIHNEYVVEKLKEKNVFPIIKETELKNIKKNSIIVIRSHGVGKNVIENLKKAGYQVYEGTCPFVKRVHRNGLQLQKEGYTVILIGEKNHPEVQGISATLQNKVIIINDENEIEKLKNDKGEKIGIIIQTTQEYQKVNNIIKKIFEKFKEIKIFNTVCNATYLRQKYAAMLSKKVDLMIIIGSKGSGNTKRLFEVCKKNIDNCFLLSDINEINNIEFKDIKKIGISAGASTPDWLIKNFIEKIKKIYKNIKVINLKTEELEDKYGFSN